MSRVVMALILFGLAAWVGSGTREGYRDGKMPFVWLGGINPLVFDHVRSPAWFWGALAINLMIGTGLALGGILVLTVGAMR